MKIEAVDTATIPMGRKMKRRAIILPKLISIGVALQVLRPLYFTLDPDRNQNEDPR